MQFNDHFLLSQNRHYSFKGFALIEVLVAMSIASIVVLSIYSGVSSGTLAISQNSNLTRAIIIAKMKLGEFRINGMRGTDLSHEAVKEYQGFTLTRTTVRYSFLNTLPAKKTTITVEWQEQNRPRTYSLFTVYPEL
jgi:type II secretion system protein I